MPPSKRKKRIARKSCLRWLKRKPLGYTIKELSLRTMLSTTCVRKHLGLLEDEGKVTKSYYRGGGGGWGRGSGAWVWRLD